MKEKPEYSFDKLLAFFFLPSLFEIETFNH